MRAVVFLAALLSACAHFDAEAGRKSLLQADTDFARDVAARGTDAWVEAFAEDGAMMVNNRPAVRGRASIREVMSDLGDPRKAPPGLQIRWRPLGAQVSDDGTMGWTYGNSVLVAEGKERQGKYVTVWRKQADGSWKVAVDLGVNGWADPASPP